jgi:hypothetical protein
MGVFPQEEKMLQATLDRRESLAVERWVDEQMFEEDVRAVLKMIRPNRRERLMGWKEYRTGGANFRVTVSWNEEFEAVPPTRTLMIGDSCVEQPPAATQQSPRDGGHALVVPHMTDVIESFLIGSARDQDEISAAEEFGYYRAVVAELARRIDEMEACYT